MRIGLSWDLDSATDDVPATWGRVRDEAVNADRLGYDSVWVPEGHNGRAACPAPAHLLTAIARTTGNVALRASGRTVGRAVPVRLAEEIALLDSFSRGRAGIGFAAASRQGVDATHVHETIDFCRMAWTADEFRYRGEHVRFPAHTPDDAPPGASEPDGPGAPYLPYVPQWERGPLAPDFLAITPKPFQVQPPAYVEIDDDDTLAWAAEEGVSPFLGADVPLGTATERLSRYREARAAAGRSPHDVEPVLERWINLDGGGGRGRGGDGGGDNDGDDIVLAGAAAELVDRIRALRIETGIRHLVWRRDPDRPDTGEVFRFVTEVHPLLQA